MAAGVEAGRDRRGGEHPHRRRQMGVDPLDEGPRGERPWQLAVHHLAARVDAGVGAPGATGDHPGTSHCGERLFERRLHGRRIGLALPAGERLAEVGDGQAEAHGGEPSPDFPPVSGCGGRR